MRRKSHERGSAKVFGLGWHASGAAHCRAGRLVARLPASRRAGSRVSQIAQAPRQSAAEWDQILCHGGLVGTDERAELAYQGYSCHQPALAPEKRPLQTPRFKEFAW